MTHWRAIFILWVAGLVVWSPMLVPASYWYELRSIRIEDGIVGEPPAIGVDRIVRRDFTGSYSVRILAFPSNNLICVAGPFEPFPYRTTDAPLEGKDLAWWMRDRDAYDACVEQGMGAGNYVVVTNHYILHPWRFIPWVNRVVTPDVASNVFTIYATATPLLEQLQQQQVEIEELREQVDEAVTPLGQVLRGLIQTFEETE